MEASTQQIIDNIQSLRLGEVQHLIASLEDALGVKASQPVTLPQVVPEPTVEPTEFDVVLVFTGEKRISTIKAVRQALGLGLREARDAVATLPAVLREQVPMEVAVALKAAIEAAGGAVEIR